MVALKLDVLGRFSQMDDNTKTQVAQATLTSTCSGLTGLTIGDMSTISGKSTVCDSKGKENENFHQVLFGEIKSPSVGGKTVKSRDIYDKVKKGKLPPLPQLKANGRIMCCPRAAGHGATYSVSEYQPLCGWCDANYPKDE